MRTRLPLLLLCLVIAGCESYIEAKTREALEQNQRPIDLGPGLHLALCGTGTPQSSERHLPPCNAIVAGDQFLVFDTGEGAARTLNLMGLHTRELDAVFITHWHSDHFGGLDALINDSWIFGRQQPLPVYGPDGVEPILAGLAQAYAQDIAFRVTGRPGQLDAASAAAVPHHVAIAQKGLVQEVYRANGVVVSAFRVDHEPVTPAYGFKIEYGGRSVVISGDTRVSAHTEKAARGADVLVHESLNHAMMDRAIRVASESGFGEQASHMAEVLDYHADTLGLAQMAQRAGVKRLVLTHQIPGPPNRIAEWLFMRGTSAHYQGTVTVARDRMRITLPVR